MKINKKSWHYRNLTSEYSIWETNVPNNLCGYFWASLFNFFCQFIVLSAVLFLFFTLIPAPVLYFGFDYQEFQGLGIAGIVFGGAIFLVFLGFFLFNFRLVREFFKAKKDKYCPRIEFED